LLSQKTASSEELGNCVSGYSVVNETPPVTFAVPHCKYAAKREKERERDAAAVRKADDEGT
jgi:hypothetical protein